jgi:hypothetical protein
MKRFNLAVVAAAWCTAVACGDDKDSSTSPSSSSSGPKFFVTSDTSTTGNLGGLAGADARCQRLANTAGFGNKTWHAYLSVERDSTGARVDARSRIGQGPWTNVNGVTVARDLTELHSRRGDYQVFIDERGQPIPGQWPGTPSPVQHDILTGSNADGTLMAGFTCADWTSDSASAVAQVGHSDGLGPGGDSSGALSSWNSSHANQNCANTAPRGGAGRLYCFAIN